MGAGQILWRCKSATENQVTKVVPSRQRSARIGEGSRQLPLAPVGDSKLALRPRKVRRRDVWPAAGRDSRLRERRQKVNSGDSAAESKNCLLQYVAYRTRLDQKELLDQCKPARDLSDDLRDITLLASHLQLIDAASQIRTAAAATGITRSILPFQPVRAIIVISLSSRTGLSVPTK